MATKLGSNQELNQCAEQTKKSIKDLNNIDLNSENAATSLEDIAKNADQTQKQLDQLAAANDTEFSNTLNNQLAQDQQISQKDEQDDTNEAEYRNEVNQSE